jgi:hypothetical protein
MRPAPLGRIRGCAPATAEERAVRTGAAPGTRENVWNGRPPRVPERPGTKRSAAASVSRLQCCGFSVAAEEVERPGRGYGPPIHLRFHHVKGARVGQVGERILTGRVGMEEVDRAEQIHFKSESGDIVVPAS